MAHFPDPVPGTPYTLTCTFKQTNTDPIPALFIPSAYVTSARIADPIFRTRSVNYTWQEGSDPIDPFKPDLTFETGANVDGSLIVIFSRSVGLNGVNASPCEMTSKLIDAVVSLDLPKNVENSYLAILRKSVSLWCRAR